MINLPMPYPEELIYSTVARYKIRTGLISPKQLLDDVFEDRGVVATVDLPCHLSKILSHYPQNIFNLHHLVHQHTLFLLYAPFIPENRRQECLKWMSGYSQGAIHLSIGRNASRLPSLKYIRYCPQCFDEQFKIHGEWYWARIWQISGANCCIKHGNKLVDSLIEYRPASRHDFIAPNTRNCLIYKQESASEYDLFITSKIAELLSLGVQVSPDLMQWTAFYQGLARSYDCIKGSQHIDHQRIIEKVKKRWSLEFLEQNNLNKLDCETGWLRGIFRKHRKSFSYMEHIIAIESMLEGQAWTFSEIIAEVKNQPFKQLLYKDQTKNIHKVDMAMIEENRNLWLKLIENNKSSVKEARKAHQALYAWLYRNDQQWLMKTNKRYHQYYIPKGLIVDWEKRDVELVKSLISLDKQIYMDLILPRKSKKWWMQQIGAVSLIEKNLDKLPKVSKFLGQCSEDISEYQIRRLSRVLIDSFLNKEYLQRWEVLRLARLSDERISPEANQFLAEVHNIVNQQIKKVSI